MQPTLYSTTAQFTAWAAQVAEATAAGYPYYLREMGMVGPIGLAGVTNTFAASLWTLNFFLYAATLGIAQVNFHMTKDSNASAWQPIPWPPYSPVLAVRPAYYAFAAMAQIIGRECSTQIAPLAITHTDGQPAEYDNASWVHELQGGEAGVGDSDQHAAGERVRDDEAEPQLRVPPPGPRGPDALPLVPDGRRRRRDVRHDVERDELRE